MDSPYCPNCGIHNHHDSPGCIGHGTEEARWTNAAAKEPVAGEINTESKDGTGDEPQS